MLIRVDINNAQPLFRQIAAQIQWTLIAASPSTVFLWLLIDRVRVTVEPFGMRASMGALGFPRVVISIDQIVQASTLHVRPTFWGDWGYRGSLKALQRSAMIVRSGEGIRVDLNGGAMFVVSINDAVTGASVLQGAVEAQSNRNSAAS